MVQKYGVDIIEGFEEDLSTLLVGVDSLFGGDVMHQSGTKHVIADNWTSGKPAPAIYNDPLSVIFREIEGVHGAINPSDVEDYVRKYNLLDLKWGIKDKIREFDDDRERYVINLVDSLDIMLRTAMAMADKDNFVLPSFEERVVTSTANLGSLELADPEPEREVLRIALAREGFEVSNSRNLRETVNAWHEKQELIPKEKIKSIAELSKLFLLGLTREEIFRNLDFGIEGLEKDLSDVHFGGHRFETVSDVFFTGSSIYRGGEVSGLPAFNGLFEFNTDHPLTDDMLLFLTSHEVVPGHYLNSAITDLLWRNGKLGFEATTAVMCTPSAVFHEGWAQNAFCLFYGSNNLIPDDQLEKSLAVHLAYEELEDIAKNNAAIKHQYRGESLDEVKRYVAEECVQGDSVVKKMSGAWAQHPIIGPMYGQAYYLGRSTVRKAIKDVGKERVAKVGFHLEGLVDIATFKSKVYSKQ